MMAETKKTVLITGSTRSIGLALAEYYTKEGWTVIGTARANSTTTSLKALSPFKIVTLDTSNEESVLDAARQLEEIPIDLLINNAGIWVPDSFKSATKDSFMRQFEVNSVGPFLVTRALLPNLELAVKKNGSAYVAQVTSLLGSIGSNTPEFEDFFSQGYGYAASKAALNMVTRSMSVHLRQSNIGFVTLHPGYVATDINDHQGYMKPSTSAEAMANIVANLKLEDTGKFFNADEQYPVFELPW
ncbi:C-factor [Phytophthora citrophthora]|nr:C-factor [Phytophthora citrophthora]